MSSQAIACFLAIFCIQLYVSTSDGAETDTLGNSEMDKRRGWGKRFSPQDALADNELDAEMDKRRGWGKRFSLDSDNLAKLDEVSKRRGWGKRSTISTLDDEMDKRRGWGKRSMEEVDKRRGWGKRSFDGLDSEDIDKRRGWGKRSSLDEFEAMDKRRGWGKRGYGWGKRATDLLSELQDQSSEYQKRYGWGKRSSESEVCAAMRKEVAANLYNAVQAEALRVKKCPNSADVEVPGA